MSSNGPKQTIYGQSRGRGAGAWPCAPAGTAGAPRSGRAQRRGSVRPVRADFRQYLATSADLAPRAAGDADRRGKRDHLQPRG